MSRQQDIITAIIFWTTIAILGRIIPHLPNATPLTSLSLVAGALLTRPKALFVTFLALFLSDSLLAYLYHYPILGSWSLFTYSGFCFCSFCGRLIYLQNRL